MGADAASLAKNVVAKLAAIVLLVGFFFGAFVIVVAPFEIWRKAEAERWPSRKGVIVKAYAREARGSGMRGGPYWKPEICGQYRGTAERFCVARVRFGSFTFGDGKDSAFEAVARYPAGREVDVYHAPDNPKETLLEARSSWKEMSILLGLGIVLFLSPVILWCIGRWSRRPAPQFAQPPVRVP